MTKSCKTNKTKQNKTSALLAPPGLSCGWVVPLCGWVVNPTHTQNSALWVGGPTQCKKAPGWVGGLGCFLLAPHPPRTKLGFRQNTGYHNPQISVHSACLEKNQDVTHAGGPTLSNKISESFGMCCQNDQKCRLPSTETEKIRLSTLNNSPQAQQQFFYSYSPLRNRLCS